MKWLANHTSELALPAQRKVWRHVWGNAWGGARRTACCTARNATRYNAGFTIVELLAALAILTILGTMVASAMVTGSRVMTSTTATANAAVLEQSIETALSDVLRYASTHVPTGSIMVDDPEFDSDSYYDYSGAVVRDGRIQIEDGKIALVTARGTQYVPKAAGIYTDFVITDFALSYDCAANMFTASYVIASENGVFNRQCEFVCRSLVEESYF